VKSLSSSEYSKT